MNKSGERGAIVGWDIGGAHLKAARVEGGALVDVRQIACPLWLGDDNLGLAFAEIDDGYLDAPEHAVTMTGELAENFSSRADGVRRILAICGRNLKGRIRVYSARSGLVAAEAAPSLWKEIGSANWHATAALAAKRAPDALLIDIGSTTADVVPIAGGEVAARGYTDAERLAAGELVYTGVIRSSLMTLSHRAPFAGAWQPLMAENYATAADLYRLTGELDERDDLYPASDGRGKSAPECHARIARLLGRDAEEAPAEDWNRIARYFREQQLRLVHDAAFQALSAARLPQGAPIVGAGAGHFLARDAAARLSRPYVDFADLIAAHGETARMARLCAPAAAVALLAVSGANA